MQTRVYIIQKAIVLQYLYMWYVSNIDRPVFSSGLIVWSD